MTSTNVPQISRRLPPLSGLLDDTLDQAVRTRRRRIMMADKPSLNLNALRVPDMALDRLLHTVALYGADAARQLDVRIGELTGAAKEAAVFLRIALAVQTLDVALFELAARHAQEFARAVREAYWFYPIPSGPFSDHSGHIIDLFEKSAGSPTLRLIAIELAGRRDVKALRLPIEALLDDPQYAAHVHVALSCMGAATQATRRYAQEALATGEATACMAAMALIAVDPRIADASLLQDALKADPARVGAAWAIATCRDPRGLYQQAVARADVPTELRYRITALAGYVDGIIAACGEMATSDGPVTAAQADVLELALGGVPVEARCEPNVPADKSRALRALLLRACRRSHIPVCNDADMGPWDVQGILAKPEQAGTIRLRNGLPLGAEAPALGRAVLEVTHALRQWLFIERATIAQHALSLSAFDTARRQELAMMVGEYVDDIRAP
ncbi:hypothetical protein RBA41_33085 [Massilia sp. CCM 9210]|uniref:hypothetical protein n=1 Tax=Massilia scottii TaxID=3057166 RepID=UPI00279662C1|nr:hypothetical protein [Massilia sp. CCM 9210]MDQ1818145.1 hypothetical protein [Massilia sp. CCM 9210]